MPRTSQKVACPNFRKSKSRGAASLISSVGESRRSRVREPRLRWRVPERCQRACREHRARSIAARQIPADRLRQGTPDPASRNVVEPAVRASGSAAAEARPYRPRVRRHRAAPARSTPVRRVALDRQLRPNRTRCLLTSAWSRFRAAFDARRMHALDQGPPHCDQATADGRSQHRGCREISTLRRRCSCRHPAAHRAQRRLSLEQMCAARTPRSSARCARRSARRLFVAAISSAATASSAAFRPGYHVYDRARPCVPALPHALVRRIVQGSAQLHARAVK